MKYTIKAEANTAQIYIYGFIDPFDCSSAEFAERFRELDGKYDTIEIRINSPGGSVFEGVAMFNMIRKCQATTIAYIDGIAASMGSVIAMACSKIYMSKYGRMMVHAPSGWVDGSAAEMQNYAGMLESITNDLASIYSERTGLTAEEAKTKWLSGGDKWFTPQEAVDAKLIDGIYDGMPISEPKAMTGKPEDMWKFYNKLEYNPNQITDMKKIIAILASAGIALPGDANEDAISAKLEEHFRNHNANVQAKLDEKQNKINELQGIVDGHQTEKIKGIVDAAIVAGKFEETQREAYTKMLVADFDNANSIIGSLQPIKTIAAQIKSEEASNERATWTFEDYSKKDPKALAEIKANDAAKYKKLFKDQYGVEPKK